MAIIANAYTYDQLHRLSHSKSFANFDAAANAWQQGSSYAGMYENSFTYDANGNIETQVRKGVNGDSLDVLSYHYHDGDYGRQRNRLYHVNDAVSASAHADDIDDQGTFVSAPTDLNTANNYGYDPLGQLIRDDQEGITAITWRNDGKVRDIFRASGVAQPRKELSFDYSPYGHRLSKKVYQPGNDSELLHADYYIRDAQGNVMATYGMKIDLVEETVEYVVTERPIYGSDRLGLYKHEQVVYPAPPTTTAGFAPVHRGERHYELKNHLGNVMAVVSGHKIPVESSTTPGTVGHFLPLILHTADYSPFGVQLPERTYEGEGYRYGFNGMEKDDEVTGKGGSLNYKARIQDTRLGRFLSIDPLTMQFPHYSPYQFAGNKPIQAIDLDGKEEFIKTNFIDANGTLYRTQIQVINHISSSEQTQFGIGPIQVIHNTDVVVDNFGNASVQYTGSIQGSFLQAATSPLVGPSAPGSSGFSLAENLSIANSTVRPNTNGLITDQISVFAAKKQIIRTTYKNTSPTGVPIKLERNGKDISTSPVNLSGLVEINYADAPALEPRLPDGFNVTPAMGQRFTTPGASPVEPTLLNNRSTILPQNNNLNAISTKGTTQAQPAGTQEQVPQRNGDGESTITHQ